MKARKLIPGMATRGISMMDRLLLIDPNLPFNIFVKPRSYQINRIKEVVKKQLMIEYYGS